MGIKLKRQDEIHFKGKAFTNFSEKFTHYSFMGGRKISADGTHLRFKKNIKMSFGSVLKDIGKLTANVILFPLTLACLAAKIKARRSLTETPQEKKTSNIRDKIFNKVGLKRKPKGLKIGMDGVYTNRDLEKAPNGEDVLAFNRETDRFVVPKDWEGIFKPFLKATKGSFDTEKTLNLFYQAAKSKRENRALLIYKMLEVLDIRQTQYDNQNFFEEIGQKKGEAFVKMLKDLPKSHGVDDAKVLKEFVVRIASEEVGNDQDKEQAKAREAFYQKL